jgi:4-amino-4-deoxy-L-arabinose transferase-like glycosyltransferase
MRVNRVGLAVVVICFCAPLFVGLGRGDLKGDEAGHSFSIDRILETGDWLIPLGSAETDQAFLEKPPLKFWIVALPIRLGILPHDEFGLRFWDAVFGSLAFVYVYAIGVRLAGAVCGVVSVLTLFAFWPLVFDHGLRSNNMEAALLLCYCGGIFHYLRWTTATSDRSRRVQAVCVALYFVLGFMTKFVAALFLPLVLAIGTAVVPEYRVRFRQSLAAWILAAMVAVTLIAPWFVYAYHLFGSALFSIMFTAQVYTRLTRYLDPAHVQPWPYYWVSLGKSLSYEGARALVMAGMLVLAVQTIRRRWGEGLIVLVWFFVPMAILSFGTSKLTHYAYPFVPPLALGGGYLAALLLMLAPMALNRIAWPRTLMIVVALSGAALVVATMIAGDVRLTVAGQTLVHNTSLVRPLLVAALGACLAARGRVTARVAAGLIVALLLPLSSYAENLGRLNDDRAPLRDMRDCLLHVEATRGTRSAGLSLDVPDGGLVHPIYYYFRGVRPWTHHHFTGAALDGALGDPSTPILMARSRFDDLRQAYPATPAGIPLDDLDFVMFLPGPYASCGGDGAARPY